LDDALILEVCKQILDRIEAHPVTSYICLATISLLVTFIVLKIDGYTRSKINISGQIAEMQYIDTTVS
jgi:hypothetical protein